MKDNFIKTSDKETADQLIELGFKLVDVQGNMYTFVNNSMQLFSDDINKEKLAYSNNLCI